MPDWSKPHSEAFIEKHMDKLSKEDWSLICANQKLSESFMAKHADKLDWFFIYWRQNISHEFFDKYRESLTSGAWAVPPVANRISTSLGYLANSLTYLHTEMPTVKYLGDCLKTLGKIEAWCKDDVQESDSSCCCSCVEASSEDTMQAESKGTFKKIVYAFIRLCVFLVIATAASLLWYLVPNAVKVLLTVVAILAAFWQFYREQQ